MNKFVVVSSAACVIGAGAAAALLRSPDTEPGIPPRVENSVTSFAEPAGHPEWAVLRLGAKDQTPLSLNHKVHLDGPQNRSDGTTESLTCISCHELADDGVNIRPIQFDNHCVRCHTGDLGSIRVDSEASDEAKAQFGVARVSVPHADLSEIAALVDAQINAAIAADIARFVPPPAATDVDAPTTTEDQPAEDRPRGRGRGRGRGEDAGPKSPVEFASEQRAAVYEALQGKCNYCHTSVESASVVPGPGVAGFSVTPPNIPDQWLTRSYFSHGAHMMIECTDCHAGAPGSTTTSDVLLPGIDSCRACHTPVSADGRGGAPHACVTCHTYHIRLDPMPPGTQTAREMLGRAEQARLRQDENAQPVTPPAGPESAGEAPSASGG